MYFARFFVSWKDLISSWKEERRLYSAFFVDLDILEFSDVFTRRTTTIIIIITVTIAKHLEKTLISHSHSD